MYIYNKIHVLLPFLLHVSALIVPSSGRTFCRLKITVALYNYIGLQLLYSCLKIKKFKTILMCFTQGLLTSEVPR